MHSRSCAVAVLTALALTSCGEGVVTGAGPVLGPGNGPATLAFGKALSLTGANYMKVSGMTGATIPSTVTVEAYIQPTALSGVPSEIVFADSGPGVTIDLAIDATGKLFSKIGSGGCAGSSTTVTGTTTLVAGTRYHVAVTTNSTGPVTSLYVNGVLDSFGAVGPTGCSLNLVGIGSFDYGGNYFTGLIDEVRISSVIRYPGAFTPPSTEFVTDVNTVLLLHFNQSSTAIDSSTWNTPSGSLIGGPTFTSSPFP